MVTSELLRKIHLYLDDQISIKEFEDWYIPQLPLLLAFPPSRITDLITTIELGLAEMGSGIQSEDSFRHLLRDSLQNITIEICYPNEFSMVSTGTTDEASVSTCIGSEFATTVLAQL